MKELATYGGGDAGFEDVSNSIFEGNRPVPVEALSERPRLACLCIGNGRAGTLSSPGVLLCGRSLPLSLEYETAEFIDILLCGASPPDVFRSCPIAVLELEVVYEVVD